MKTNANFYWQLIQKTLKANNKQGQISLLLAAVILSVTVTMGLLVFVDRVTLMLEGESRQFMAADKVLISSSPIDKQWINQAHQNQLETAKVLLFRSMLYIDDEPYLVNTKAVNDTYPLLGKLEIKPNKNAPIKQLNQGPRPGKIWVDNRLLQRAKATTNQPAELGEAIFTMSNILVSEPDAGAVAFSFAPKVMMHASDLDKTDIIQEGSRITYRYLFKGRQKDLAQFSAWLTPKLGEHSYWQPIDKEQPGVAKALERAETFLRLSTSIVLILAGLAIAMTATRFAKSQFHQVAVLKTLGVRSNQLLSIYLGVLVVILLIGVIIGSILGYSLQKALTATIAAKLHLEPENPGLFSWISGLLMTIVTFTCFTLPPLMALKRQPAMQIFSQSHTITSISAWQWIFASLLLIPLLVIINHDWRVILIILSTIALLLILFTLPISVLLQKITAQRSNLSPLRLIIFSNLRRQKTANALLLSIFSSSLILVAVLIGAQQSLFSEWQQQLPEKTPNHFLLNIQEDELAEVTKWLSSYGSSANIDSTTGETQPISIYPIVRGRLVAINNTLIKQQISKEIRQRAGVNRELNLSWANHLPGDNQLLEGQWLSKIELNPDEHQVSVESKLAERLGIKLNDTLLFSIGAEEVNARVTSLRKVDWDRMHPNFFMLFDKKSLDSFDKTYMTSFYISDDQKKNINQLLQTIPTLVIVDLDAVIQQIRTIVKQVSSVLLIILMFVIIGGLLVLIATVQSSMDERKKENTIIRAIGANKQLIQHSVLLEFIILGCLSGIIAAIGSEGILQLIQSQLLDLPLKLHPTLWIALPLVSVIMITITGFLSTRKVVKTSPVELLRNL
ncbi:MAG: FtsX-like permease family protein [Cellvibrionales bacterium]|nr:FtsX-like permease family protein [Cellvibrionales bacterium]